MSNLAINMIRAHRHRWNEIVENPSGIIIGRHCFVCVSTEMYPEIGDLGEVEDFVLVDPKDFIIPRDSYGKAL